jgi:hypothetical protein
MRTLCPAPTSDSAPAGTSAIRFSFVLISFGTPIFIVVTGAEVDDRWEVALGS